MLISDKKLRSLYKSMSAESKGPATINYILAMESRLSEARMEVEALRTSRTAQSKAVIERDNDP